MRKTALLYNAGFTMVELLVVVSIIAIMTGALIPSFSAYTRNQALRQAQEQIINDLFAVQNNAISGKKGNSTTAPVTHWGLKLTANNSQYVHFTKTSSQTVNQACTSPNIERTLSLGEGLVSPNTKCVLFSLGNGDATLVDSSQDVFVKRVGGACFKITVNSAGLIKRVSGIATCP